MKINTNTLRNILEWISAPFFAFIVIHMAGHGGFLLLEGGHHNHAHADESHAHLIDTLLSPEVLLGVLLLIIFVWIWHRPFMQKFVPCRHTHCSHGLVWPHILATLAFAVHFFPEAQLRLQMLEQTDNFINIAGIIAFTSHFIIDIIVGSMMSLYWQKPSQKILSFVFLACVWCLAFWGASQQIEFMHESGIITLLGAFFLAMFVHFPHHKS